MKGICFDQSLDRVNKLVYVLDGVQVRKVCCRQSTSGDVKLMGILLELIRTEPEESFDILDVDFESDIGKKLIPSCHTAAPRIPDNICVELLVEIILHFRERPGLFCCRVLPCNYREHTVVL